MKYFWFEQGAYSAAGSVDVVVWPVKRRFPHHRHLKFKKPFNDQGEILSNY